MKKVIDYFSTKHIFTNFLVIAIFLGALYYWNETGKEEMPDMTFDFAMVTATYQGAGSEEIEDLVTVELEEALSGIDGIVNLSSTSSEGRSTVRLELDPERRDRDVLISEIKDAAESVKLPSDVETPVVREFKSSRRAVIDFALIYDEVDLLNEEQRLELQGYADILQSRLERLSEVSEVSVSGYLERYIEIQVIPANLTRYNISLSELLSAVEKNSIKQPLGSLDDEEETRVRLDAEIYSAEELRDIIVRSDFAGNAVLLRQLATVTELFKEQSSIRKVNGSEAVTLNVTKSSSAGILEAVDLVIAEAESFRQGALKDSPLKLVVMDDGSEGVRNRLSLIAMNGLTGFILILVILLIFLNVRSAIWVAMGIPFTFGVTMIIASLMGNSINNITLAAVIIVMGMIVDDAIVVAENVSRLRGEGLEPGEAVVKGTATVFLPIVGSITTTCIAFVPLYFFQGRIAMMIKFIPPIIFIMLGASLFEALFILPAHLRYHFPRWVRVLASAKKGKKKNSEEPRHWFLAVENLFGRLLSYLLRIKILLFLIFIALLVYSGWIFVREMKFSMFPREETTSLYISAVAPEGTLKAETERRIRAVEEVLAGYLGREVISFRTNVARSRRGGAANENVATISIELVSRENRELSSKELTARWEEEFAKIEGFESLKFAARRFGQSSGSPIEIVIKENDNQLRRQIAGEILAYLERMPSLTNAEIETERYDPQYTLEVDRALSRRLGISTESIASTIRTLLSGSSVFEIKRGELSMDVLLTVKGESKSDIESILEVPVQNNSRYLVPLKRVVKVKKGSTSSSIVREGGKRILHVYADLNEKKEGEERELMNVDGGSRRERRERGEREKDRAKRDELETQPREMLDLPVEMTPLEIAEHLEGELFPALAARYPTCELSFDGEIANTRESGADFQYALVLVIFLVYIVLALTLNSMTKPLIIMLSIPFGCVGVILALKLHGMQVYGFFSAIGALGLAGVVVNDSIILLSRLEREYPERIKEGGKPHLVVADIAKTRLRAVLLTTITTVAGLLPTAYGIFGYDSMLAEMMLTMAWGLIFGTLITLLLVPAIYCSMKELKLFVRKIVGRSS